MKCTIIIFLVNALIFLCITNAMSQQLVKDSAYVVKLYLQKNNTAHGDTLDNANVYYLINFMSDSLNNKNLQIFLEEDYLKTWNKKQWVNFLNNKEWIPFVNGEFIKKAKKYLDSNLFLKIKQYTDTIENRNTTYHRDSTGHIISLTFASTPYIYFRPFNSDATADVPMNSLRIFKVYCEGFIDTVSQKNFLKIYNDTGKDFMTDYVAFIRGEFSSTGGYKEENYFKKRKLYINQSLKRNYPMVCFFEACGEVISEFAIKLKE